MNSTWKALAMAVVGTVISLSISSLAESAADQASASSGPKSVPEGTSDDKAKRKEQFLKERLESRFSTEAENRESAYIPFLTELGLTQDQIKTVLSRLDALLRGAVEAGDPRQECVIAKAKYAGDMKILLGDSAFAQYEAFELANPYQSEKQQAVYASFLSEHGLSQDEINAALSRLDLLAKGEIMAEAPMQKLRIARADYRSEMKALLGDTRFAKYEAFEMAKPYRREASYIDEYAAKQKAQVDPKVQTRLVELLQEFQLHTTETWDGPYDPLPRPLAGTKSVVGGIDEYTSRISSGMPGFTAKASAELPPELLNLVNGYYSMKLQEFSETRARASMTRAEREAERQRFHEEMLLKARANQRKPVPDL